MTNHREIRVELLQSKEPNGGWSGLSYPEDCPDGERHLYLDEFYEDRPRFRANTPSECPSVPGHVTIVPVPPSKMERLRSQRPKVRLNVVGATGYAFGITAGAS